MDILLRDSRFRRQCNSDRLLQRKYGTRRAGLIRRRLDDLRAATCLGEISKLPPARCHELVGKRKGQLSVDLEHPYRLVFEPANEPCPRLLDGGLDWSEVTAVRMIGVEDTHE